MPTEMKVLFLTHEIPFPVRSGGQMYTANVIQWLALRSDVDLTVLAVGNSCQLEDVPPGANWSLFAAPRGSGVWRGLLGRYPRSTAATMSPAYRRGLRRLLDAQPWDAIVIDYIAIGWVLEEVARSASRVSGNIVYLSHNVEAKLRRRIADGYSGPAALRWVALRDAKKAEVLEGRIVRAADLVTAETEEDAKDFREFYGANNIHIYRPGYDGHVVEVRHLPLAETRRAVAVIGSRIATMKRLVLDDILTSLTPRLAVEGIGLVIAGDAPTDYLEARAKEFSSAEFHGYVADIAGLLENVRIGLITDHIGGGFKHRILTLVFNRVPIMATPEAMAGLPVEPDVHYIAVRDNRDAAARISNIIDKVEILDAVQRAAFNACRPEFDWASTTDQFVRALTVAPAGGGPGW